jgi:hypothetical protein
MKLRVKCRQTQIFAPSVFTPTPSKRPTHFEPTTGSALRSHLHSQQCECTSSGSGPVTAPQAAVTIQGPYFTTSERQCLQPYILQSYSRPLPEIQLRVLLLK